MDCDIINELGIWNNSRERKGGRQTRKQGKGKERRRERETWDLEKEKEVGRGGEKEIERKRGRKLRLETIAVNPFGLRNHRRNFCSFPRLTLRREAFPLSRHAKSDVITL